MSVTYGFYLYTEDQLSTFSGLLNSGAVDDAHDYIGNNVQLPKARLTDVYAGFVVWAFEEEYDRWRKLLSEINRERVHEFAKATILISRDSGSRVCEFSGVEDAWECFSLLSNQTLQQLLDLYDSIDMDDVKSTYPEGLQSSLPDLIAYLESWRIILEESYESQKHLLINIG